MVTNSSWVLTAAAETLDRLLPRLASRFTDTAQFSTFSTRARRHFPAAFGRLHQLYGQTYDFFYHLEQILTTTAEAFVARPADLHALDTQRLADPAWLQSHRMMGAVCYVDRFAGTLAGLHDRLPYLSGELGLTYLHLMPLFKVPVDNNDGGYAVSSFREVDPALGTMDELADLTREFRQHGISLVLDFVFNHTSDEHDWALRAKAGEPHYQNYYRIFPDRTLPDAYQPHLREIFPEQSPGAFTFNPTLKQWVWTTFYPFQWDLNYANPALFNAMLGEMLFLANQGVEVLRLDAVPFIWKELGTSCENLPQVNWIIEAYNALVRIAAPTLLFKSEAIVHPRDVRSDMGEDRCQLSYNPILMVSLWEALATREVYFLTHTMQKQFLLTGNAAWLNYVRSHDDIGWGFADEDAADVGIKGDDHRYFLNMFYTGRFPGSFANGQPFNFNPHTGDMRISGTAASLAGLEKAIAADDPLLIEYALKRLHLIYGIVCSVGGIPLLYLGDEVAMLNDYTYTADPTKTADNRWLHRPAADAQRYAQREDANSPSGQLFTALKRLIDVRRTHPVFANGETEFIHSGNPHVLAITRRQSLLILGNFSEKAQTLPAAALMRYLAYSTDLITGDTIAAADTLTLEPYQLLWLAPRRSAAAQ